MCLPMTPTPIHATRLTIVPLDLRAVLAGYFPCTFRNRLTASRESISMGPYFTVMSVSHQSAIYSTIQCLCLYCMCLINKQSPLARNTMIVNARFPCLCRYYIHSKSTHHTDAHSAHRHRPHPQLIGFRSDSRSRDNNAAIYIMILSRRVTQHVHERREARCLNAFKHRLLPSCRHLHCFPQKCSDALGLKRPPFVMCTCAAHIWANLGR